MRARLRARRIGYVLAIARNQRIQATDTVRLRVDDVAAGLSDAAWELRTCGPGSKGERFYDWAWVHDHTTADAGRPQPARAPQRRHRRAGVLPLLDTPARSRWPR